MSIAIQSTPGSFSSAASASRRSLQEAVRLAAEDASRFALQADLVLVVDPNGLLLHASAAWERIFGGPADRVLGEPILRAIPGERLDPAHGRALMDGLRTALLEGTNQQIPLRYRDSELGWRDLEGRCYGGAQRNRTLLFHDVTSELATWVSLIESEGRLRRVADACRDMVTESDSRGRFTYASRACQDVLGYSPEELIQTSPRSLHHPEDVDAFLDEVRGQGSSYQPFQVSPHRLRHKQGHWIWAEATGVRYRHADGSERLLGVARDITRRIEEDSDRRELEERMLRSQKLESLGVLAGGIAHDFNNLLTPIVGNAGLLLADLPEDAPARRWAAAIRTAGHRATALTTQMLTYAGQTSRQVAMLDVSDVIDDVSLLLETTASSACRVRYDLARDLPPVHGDTGQITQIVMNLVANASEAMGPDGGWIDVRTRVLEADRGFLDACYLGESRRDGAFVVLEVQDDGPGLEPDIHDRIFDPFFTTKFTGRGLGLAFVLGAVQAHEGALEIDSEPERGSTFRVLLPAQRLRADSSPGPASGKGFSEAKLREKPRLLVVDDDDGARELTVTVLLREGFEVLPASSGPEGIALYRSRGHEIDGILLDGTMPGMSGAHVFDQLRQLDPDARILLLSGHSRARTADPLLDQGLSGFLHKPYEAEQLLRAIRLVLDSG